MVVRMPSDRRGRRGAGGAHGNRVRRSRLLRHGLVELVGHQQLIGEHGLDVADDADDLSPFHRVAAGPGDAPAERAPATEEAAGHRLVDDVHLGRGERVALGEGAPVEHPGADGLEIVRADAVEGGGGLVPRLRRRLAGDDVLAGLQQAEEWHRPGDAGGSDAGQRFEPLQGEALELRQLPGARVRGGREAHGAGDEVVGYLVSQGVRTQPPQTAPYGMKQLFATDPDGYELCFQWPAEQTDQKR
jgi:hypothetical protein